MAKRKGIENLTIPMSTEEARRRGTLGGKASAESRRKRKSLKESMNTLLSLDIKNTKDWNKVAAMGIDPGEIDNSQLIILALFNRAKMGDVYAIKELRELIGEEHESKDEVIKIVDDID